MRNETRLHAIRRLARVKRVALLVDAWAHRTDRLQSVMNGPLIILHARVRTADNRFVMTYYVVDTKQVDDVRDVDACN